MVIKLLDIFPEKTKQLLLSRNWNDFGLDRIDSFNKGIILEGSEDDILDFIEDYFDCEREEAPTFFKVLTVDSN